ncbi:MAG TPA: SIMPL domain-containing protein [Pseudonocardiaceae bacterium]|jgi:hypothetical protein|nr:SIMPL domain-containing protein [Pseudonocardiaceae bacterium]
MAEVVTSGTGEVERIADRAQLQLRYTATAKDRSGAVATLSARIAKVERVLERPGVEIRTRRLSVHDTWDGKRRNGAAADQFYLLRITELGGLDDLIGELIGTEPTTLDGPNWELAQDAEARREAQRLAVHEAMATARGYTDALGGQLGPLVRITDESGPAGAASVRHMALRSSAPAGPSVAELNLEPQSITVAARCTATWEFADQGSWSTATRQATE